MPFIVPLRPTDLEQRASYDPRNEPDPDEVDAASLQAWLDEATARPDWSALIVPLLDRLPPLEADTIEMTVAGCKQADIAFIFGVTQAAISYRLDRGIQRLKFLTSLPDITDDLALLPTLFDEISTNIVNAVWSLTSQTVAAELLEMTQGRVRHRFLQAVEVLGRAAETKPKYANLHVALLALSKSWNVLHAVVLPQWVEREGDYVVPL